METQVVTGYQYSGDNSDFFGNCETHYVLERLQDHKFAHIVCHGIPEPGKPFDSSFAPHIEAFRSLLDTVGSRLPGAFAFLLACHSLAD